MLYDPKWVKTVVKKLFSQLFNSPNSIIELCQCLCGVKDGCGVSFWEEDSDQSLVVKQYHELEQNVWKHLKLDSILKDRIGIVKTNKNRSAYPSTITIPYKEKLIQDSQQYTAYCKVNP